VEGGEARLLLRGFAGRAELLLPDYYRYYYRQGFARLFRASQKCKNPGKSGVI
jgi:hypothetical protein